LALILALFSTWGIAAPAEELDAGFLFDRFSLTLERGTRTEAFGPLFYNQETDFENIFAFPPLFSHSTIPATDSEEYDFLYPLLTYDRYGREYRWQLGQLFSIAGGQNQDEVTKRRFTLFPFYFQQRSAESNQNYTALFPIYGHLQNRIFRSEMDFVLWPLYIKTVKRPSVSPLPDDPFTKLGSRFLSSRRGDVTTYNYGYPFFHLRYGDGLQGWQLWPLAGHEHKEVTHKTNDWGDVEMTPGYDRRFTLWPFYFKQERDIGTDNPEQVLGVLPFYQSLRSPRRDCVSYVPVLGVTITDDRARKYHEVDAPWPLIVFARGEGKTANRVWPFFSQVHSAQLESDFYLWPLYKFNGIHGGALKRGRTRILFFLYQHTRDESTETGRFKTRTDCWPLFLHRRDLNGNTRLQVLAPLETFLPTSKSIERNYSPVWSVWRAEHNPKTGEGSQSLLWNLYRRETSPTVKKGSLLFGLFQYESSAESLRWRLFYLPLTKTQKSSDHVSEHR
jgi:hypothetical protein